MLMMTVQDGVENAGLDANRQEDMEVFKLSLLECV